MASVSDVQAVRSATDEASDQEFSDARIGALVDDLGVAGACAQIWREKAGKYAGDVDVSEAGASHKLSDLHKNALAMAAHYDGVAASEGAAAVSSRPRVKKIVRS